MAVSTEFSFSFFPVKQVLRDYGIDGGWMVNISLAEDSSGGQYTCILDEDATAGVRVARRALLCTHLAINYTGNISGTKTAQLLVVGKRLGGDPQGFGGGTSSIPMEAIGIGSTNPYWYPKGGGELGIMLREMGWFGQFDAGQAVNRFRFYFQKANDNAGTIAFQALGYYVDMRPELEFLPELPYLD